ncbi:MAG: LysR family transcriptional regulator [Pseudomonadota bacterium]
MSDDLQKRLSRIDLNLLPLLLVLMETESTQATAKRIGRTQSAVSHALNRLRDMMGDQLLVRHGPKLIPTPLMTDLQVPLRQLLGDAASIVESGVRFDPAQAAREVVIGCFDLATPLAGDLCDALKALAPGLSFHITDARSGNTRLRGGELDLLIAMYRNKAEPGQSLTLIRNLGWAFVGAKSLGLPERPSAEDWARLPHVQVHTGVQGRAPVDDAARVVGITRHVALKVNSFMQALYVASQGKMLFTTFPALIGPVAEKFDLGIYPLPFEMSAAPMSIATRTTKHDPFSLWLHSMATEELRRALGGRRDTRG